VSHRLSWTFIARASEERERTSEVSMIEYETSESLKS
jgi:hypothetical protein